MKHRYLLLLAAPAVAGLLYTAGCDDDDDLTQTPPTTPDMTARQDTTPRDTTIPPADDGVTAGAEMGAGEVSDQQLEQVTQRIEQLRARLEQAGEATPEISSFSQRLDALREAVQGRNWQQVAQTVGEIRAMQVPADYRQDFDAIVNQLRQLNVPALQNLGDGKDMPTVPGVPEPGETTPPGGGTPPGDGA